MHSFTKHATMVACSAMLVAGSASLAFAKNDKHDRDDHRGKGPKHSERVYHDHHDTRVVMIAPNDRRHIRSYLSAHHCPPGLAKKHNGCVPPGHAKRYIVGQPLPPTVVYYPVPQDLLVQLEPVPVGYQYVRVDQDILLMSEASHHIIDAITLLSAVR